jgi:hypothetical protein
MIPALELAKLSIGYDFAAPFVVLALVAAFVVWRALKS